MSQCPSCRARSECLRDGIPVPFDIMASHRHIYSSSPWQSSPHWPRCQAAAADRKSTRLNSSHQIISYAVFCLKKKKKNKKNITVKKKKKKKKKEKKKKQ